MTKSIMSEILPGDVDGWELLSLLKNHYGSAGHVSERSLVFPSLEVASRSVEMTLGGGPFKN